MSQGYLKCHVIRYFKYQKKKCPYLPWPIGDLILHCIDVCRNMFGASEKENCSAIIHKGILYICVLPSYGCDCQMMVHKCLTIHR